MSFGGQSWPISTDDMNLGAVGGGLCLGGIFDLGLGSNIGSGGGNPSWVVGDTFLVRDFFLLMLCAADAYPSLEKRLLGIPFEPPFGRVCSIVECRRRLRYVFSITCRTVV